LVATSVVDADTSINDDVAHADAVAPDVVLVNPKILMR